MKTFDWCDYTWTNEMEGGRIIQSSRPWYWYSSDVITETENGVLSLTIISNDKSIYLNIEKIISIDLFN